MTMLLIGAVSVLGLLAAMTVIAGGATRRRQPVLIPIERRSPRR
ncbi:hypothetical protein [Lacticaseibacillus parakribbianus]|nr:hypothetical protein [Lacticaseibacillus parakribbianus]